MMDTLLVILTVFAKIFRRSFSVSGLVRNHQGVLSFL